MHELLSLLLSLMVLVAIVVLWTVKSALLRQLWQPVVVVTDRVTAHHLLVRGSAGGSFSDRPLSPALPQQLLVLSRRRYHKVQNLNTVPYGPLWRAMRRNLTSDVLHPLRLHRFASPRRRALSGLIEDLSQQCKSSPNGIVLAAESIRSAMFALLANMCFGDGVDAGRIRAMSDAQNDLVQLFPELHVFSKLPGLFGRIIYRERWNKLVTLRQKQFEMYLPLIDARRSRHDEPPAYVDTLIDLWVPGGEHSQIPSGGNARMRRRLTDGELVGMCSEFLGAGTETVAAELQWIIAYLVKRPDMQEALRREIDASVGAGTEEVSEEVLGKLEYLNAVVLEALRLHPTVPSVFRQVMERDHHVMLDGRRIPVGTTVVFPPGTLARDKTAWVDPDEFKPERFLASGGGEGLSLLAAAGSAGEISLMPFGAGRRMCPGMGVALLHMAYFMANLVREFEWREAEGKLAVDLRPHVGFFNVMKRPLRAHLVLRREDKLRS